MPNLFASNLPDFTVDPDKDYFAEFVGDGKKFDSPQELARAKAESDAHILRMEAEQAALREELSTRLKYEEFLDQLKTTPLGTTSRPQDDGDTNQDKSAFNPEDIERLLEQKLNQRDAERTATQNLNIVHNKLLEVFGPNYAQHLKKQAADLGMSERMVQNLAATNPKALYKLLGVGETKENNLFEAPPRNQSTNTTFSATKAKGDSYYEELRKKQPREYWSPKIQNEIFDKIKEMGAEAYYKS